MRFTTKCPLILTRLMVVLTKTKGSQFGLAFNYKFHAVITASFGNPQRKTTTWRLSIEGHLL